MTSADKIPEKSHNADCLNEVCPLDYTPICGNDGNGPKTFKNECEMRKANCGGKSELTSRSTRINLLIGAGLPFALPFSEWCEQNDRVL